MTCKVSINSAMTFIVLNVLTVVFTDIEFIQPRNVVLVNHSLLSTIKPLYPSFFNLASIFSAFSFFVYAPTCTR